MNLATLVALASIFTAQPQGEAPQPHAPVREATPQETPAQVRLGQRVDVTRRSAIALSSVVIVRDSASYIAAVSRWSPTQRFPVLIDDGTRQSTEDIARFVRAYEPSRVLRWSVHPDDAGTLPKGMGSPTRDAIVGAACRAWAAPEGHADERALLEAFRAVGHVPPGIVVTWPDDPAWTAGLALAAGRGQPLAFIKTPRIVGSTMSMKDADEIETLVEGWASTTDLEWRGIGDALDAVTLCVNAPARVDRAVKGEQIALTDKIGRIGEGETGQRWAWCGQIFGTPAQAAYRAMAALFLQPRGAWLFDGYPNDENWRDYDITPAAQVLQRARFKVELHDAPVQSADHWRSAVARPLHADLFMVTTKGLPEWFDLTPGQCRAGDVPLLTRPALVYVIHSFSAARADDHRTIAGRFLQHGAFCYAGSVHEPFLGAFLPPQHFAMRMLTQAPFGVAARLDAGPAWKIAIFGDPLYTYGLAQTRADDAPPLADATPLDDGLRELLTGDQLARGLRTLAMLARDEDAAALACALLDQEKARVTPRVAEEAILPVLRSGRASRVPDFAVLVEPAAMQASPDLRDALWLSARPLLADPSIHLLEALSHNLRNEWDMTARDLADLTRAWMTKHGVESARTMLARVRQANPDLATQIDKAARETVGEP